ncbi:hybrid sensor histidine kinase/response regulator [Meridianimarinicoccus roseus]|uniref:histidine kinase n=1 Tax=Meridianimarinicoccus roseus TaxID=2072018 RepID=A0A2V2LGL3_9RHOB|nr:PAS-domain containing protein [Meridianimarinicoccus roseus]PWR02644.1 hybrid sensor histidine kinase/response regulator [Meridianimarinicoccus roseus]
MTSNLIDPREPLEEQHARLLVITEALMRRVEQEMDEVGAAYAQFERAVVLEDQVQQRTAELEHALNLLNHSNAQLAQASRDADAARADLSNAIEAVREGFALFNGDDVLVMCNSRFGQQIRDVQPQLEPGLHFREYVVLVSRSRFLALPRGTSPEVWAAKRLQRHSDTHVMFNVELKDDHWLQVSEHRTPGGGTVILQTDITDVIRIGREERDKLLDEQARMIRATLEHLNQGVAIFDRGARLVGWNRRFVDLLALSPIRMHIGVRFDRIAQDFRERFSVSQDSFLRTLEHWRGDVVQQTPLSFELQGANRQTLDTFARQMPDGGFVISVTNVTAEREATRALSIANETLEARVTERTLELEDALDAAERANASKSRFVAAASHDLLQPLSAAKLYLASATDGDANPLLVKAGRALESVELIIDALLDISKLDSGSAQFDFRDVALNEVLLPLRDELAPLAASKGLDLRVVPSRLSVRSDPSYLRRILQNLMGNALRYTERGKVLVGVRRMRDAVRLEVWDTGIGIREEDQELIFQEFQRLDASASANEGLGLGLAIVERACARLGHPLGLWSQPGRGSGFFVNLPIANRPGRAADPMVPQVAAGWRLKNRGMIVLLVEDDNDLRRAITVLLGKWDVSVLDAASADEAIDLLDEIEITPDAVLVDYQLEGSMDGVALAQALFERHGPLPTCILSANRSSEFRARCGDAGLPLIAKPIDAGKLERFLLSALPGEVDAEARPRFFSFD